MIDTGFKTQEAKKYLAQNPRFWPGWNFWNTIFPHPIQIMMATLCHLNLFVIHEPCWVIHVYYSSIDISLDNVWRQKYTALSRELENTRRNLTDQAEQEIQDLMNQKRATEKAVIVHIWFGEKCYFAESSSSRRFLGE